MSGVPLAVGEHAQDGKQVGAALNFIDDHQADKFFEGKFRGDQAFKVRRIFEVEIVQGFIEMQRAGSGELTRQRGFA